MTRPRVVGSWTAAPGLLLALRQTEDAGATSRHQGAIAPPLQQRGPGPLDLGVVFPHDGLQVVVQAGDQRRVVSRSARPAQPSGPVRVEGMGRSAHC